MLDIGTGPGWIPVRLALRRPAWEVHALDGSEPMLAHARTLAASQNASVTWVKGRADSLPYDAGTFDLVVSHLAFHEFEPAASVLREAVRVARPGGQVIVQDLRRPGGWGWRLAKLWFRVHPERMRLQTEASVRAAYVPSELAAIARHAGLQNVRVSKFLPFLLRLSGRKASI